MHWVWLVDREKNNNSSLSNPKRLIHKRLKTLIDTTTEKKIYIYNRQKIIVKMSSNFGPNKRKRRIEDQAFQNVKETLTHKRLGTLRDTTKRKKKKGYKRQKKYIVKISWNFGQTKIKRTLEH